MVGTGDIIVISAVGTSDVVCIGFGVVVGMPGHTSVLCLQSAFCQTYLIVFPSGHVPAVLSLITGQGVVAGVSGIGMGVFGGVGGQG